MVASLIFLYLWKSYYLVYSAYLHWTYFHKTPFRHPQTAVSAAIRFRNEALRPFFTKKKLVKLWNVVNTELRNYIKKQYLPNYYFRKVWEENSVWFSNSFTFLHFFLFLITTVKILSILKTNEQIFKNWKPWHWLNMEVWNWAEFTIYLDKKNNFFATLIKNLLSKVNYVRNLSI